MAVAIITDSAASLPEKLVGELGIAIVPLHLILDGDDELDTSLPLEELLARQNGNRVTTSAPSPGEFLTAIDETGRRPGVDAVLVATVAGHMSGTFKAAWAAANMSEVKARVLDTGTAAGAEGLVVLAAAEAARRGGSLDEVEARAQQVIDHVALVAAVNGLEHLARSGRVPGIAGWAGRVFGLQPLFEFRGGKVHRLRPAQSREAAIDRVYRRWEDSRPPDGDAALHLSVMHGVAPDEARRLLERISAEVEPATAFVAEFSPVMVVHTGPGLVGVAWWWERR